MIKNHSNVRHHWLRPRRPKPDFLIQALGTVDAERFVALINRERFDYTEWRKTQRSDETVASLATQARELRVIENQGR